MFSSANVSQPPALIPRRVELEGCDNDCKSTHLHIPWDE
jgi:hypothetical protein